MIEVIEFGKYIYVPGNLPCARLKEGENGQISRVNLYKEYDWVRGVDREGVEINLGLEIARNVILTETPQLSCKLLPITLEYCDDGALLIYTGYRIGINGLLQLEELKMVRELERRLRVRIGCYRANS